jgi:signal transduction histidine kinase
MLEVTMIIMALVLTAIASSLAVGVWTKSRRDYRKPFALLMFSEIMVIWAFAMDVFSADLGSKLFWNNFEFLGYVGCIASFFLFAVQYSNDVKFNKPLAALLVVPAVLTMIAVVTNPYHNLFYLTTEVSSDTYRSFDATYGPLFFAYMAYSIVIMLSGLVSLAVRFVRASNAHRIRVGITCLSSILAVTPVLLDYTALVPVPGGLLYVMGFLSGDLLLFVGAFGFELFSMVPFELERVMRFTKGGVFILDDEDFILYQNPTAESLTVKLATPYQDRLTDVLPSFPRDILAGTRGASSSADEAYEIVPGRFFDITLLPVFDYAGRLIGKTITLEEVTDRRRAEAEALSTKHTLDLMNSITRHDVLNQLTILEGNLMMAGRKTDAVSIQKHIDASFQAALNIQKQMQFAHDYQEMTKRTPVWQNVEDKILEASTALELKNVRLSVDTRGVEILADLLLEKVLYNLMHNSIIHGGKVGNVRFVAVEADENLELIYTDDGAGIDAKMKPALFTKGGGQNSGLGLFLSREILEHSHMTITENGEPGRGARFVIRVPKGSYRNFNSEQSEMSLPVRPSPLTP